MSWETVFQALTMALAGMGSWFLFELIKEFKDFKKETRRDIDSLQRERTSFQTTVRLSELSFSQRATDIQSLHNDFSHKIKESLLHISEDTRKIKLILDATEKKAESLENFFQKAWQLVKRHNHEIQDLKIKVGDVMIFKTKK